MEELSDPPLAENATPADAPSPSTPDHAAPPLDETTLPTPESASAPPETSPAPLESAAPAPIEASPAAAPESAASALDEAHLPALNESIAPADEATPASADAASIAPLTESGPTPSTETPAAAAVVIPQSSLETTAPAEVIGPQPIAEAPPAEDTAQPDPSPTQTTDVPRRPLPIVRRIGAGMGMLGALLVVGGALLPTYASGDYEAAALKHAPLILAGLLGLPAALVLGISIFAWFRRPGLWLIVLGCLTVILATWIHWLVEALFAALSCFDVCPAGGIHNGTGFWLPLIGFPLSGVGLVVVALTRFGRRRTQPTPTP